jgi:hypothetical protein
MRSRRVGGGASGGAEGQAPFKTERDDEALRNMFKHLSTNAAHLPQVLSSGRSTPAMAA